MSAEVLREAAALMRERAEAATGGEWSDGGAWWEHWTDPEGRSCHTPWPTITTGSLGSEIVGKVTTEADAAHIASWHPAVALAVADWLDREVADQEKRLRDLRSAFGEAGDDFMPPCDAAALAVATAYLGGRP